MKTFLALFIFVAACLGQSQRGIYVHERSTSGDELVSIVLPAAQVNRTARFVAVTVYAAGACTPTLKRDGTLPTATAATSVELNGGTTGVAVPYNASNGSGVVHIKTYNVAAGEEKVIDMPDKTLLPGKAVHIQTGCAARVFFMWREF